jgi:Xaa-Pro aminopeptidase
LILTLCLCAWLLLPWSWSGSALISSNSFSHLAGHCYHATPIGLAEFNERQKSLARVLHAHNASAYVAEPGANAQYYGNISSSHWGLSERPLLLIITPHVTGDDNVVGQVTVLTPAFEAARAKLLPIPYANVAFEEWAEDANPYKVAVSSLGNITSHIYVDPSIRNFIVDGLKDALPSVDVRSAPSEIRRLRQRKSPAELELMKCANEVLLQRCLETSKNSDRNTGHSFGNTCRP